MSDEADKREIQKAMAGLDAIEKHVRSDILAAALWDFIMTDDYRRDWFDDMYEDAGWVRRE